MAPLRLGAALDAAHFAEIRREMELAHCKWDPQVGDVSALSPSPLWIRRRAFDALCRDAEALAVETLAMEEELERRPELFAVLGLPRALRTLFRSAPSSPAAARVMRFDFHFTRDGWRVSEVNSDVPGGYTEASSFTRLVAQRFGASAPLDPAEALAAAFARSAGERAHVALTNAPGHMEDHQVVAYVAARLRDRGLTTSIVSPANLSWRQGRATIGPRPVDAIFRFFQAEWLPRLRGVDWRPLLAGGETPVANPGRAALVESKRLPLVWDRLRAPTAIWRRLLPETRALEGAPWSTSEEWLIKTAYSNNGDSVSIRSAMTASAWRWRAWSARLEPSAWLAQRRFETLPVVHDGVRAFPCVGVYVVDGVAAGAYARLATGPVVDAFARDVALLVEEDP